MRFLLIYIFTGTFHFFASAQELVNKPKDSLSVVDVQNDAAAQKFKAFYNAKQSDSIANMMNADFLKKVNATKEGIKSVFETQLFQYGEIVNMQFVKSKDSISKYKCELAANLNLQLLVKTNALGEFVVWGMQPYKDENAPKKTSYLSDNKKLSMVDSIVEKVLKGYIEKMNMVGASVGISYKGKNYFYNYGEVKKDSKQLPTNTSLYEMGSITKTFVGFLLADAVKKGKIKLDDLLIKYLPADVAKNEALQKIQIVHLSNHTSGLPRLPENMFAFATDSLQPYADYDEAALMKGLAATKLTHAPGSKYAYSNFAVGVLCTVLEKVNKKSFAQMLQETICKPFGLTNTHTSLLAVNLPKMVNVYDDKGNATNVWQFKALAGAGSIISSTKDMLQYGVKQLTNDGSALANTLALSHTITHDVSPNTVALNWHFDVAKTSTFKFLQHSGGTYGCRTHISILKEKKLVVVVLTNNAADGDATGFYLMQALDEKLK
jgi:CubicO group peptidase (beta-lactamase class C family)